MQVDYSNKIDLFSTKAYLAMIKSKKTMSTNSPEKHKKAKDDFTIGLKKQKKVSNELKTIPEKLVIELLFNFKNRETLQEKHIVNQLYESKKDRLRQIKRYERVKA